MESCGCFWPEAMCDPDRMVELSLQLNRQFGIATAKVPFSLTAECEALGCTLSECERDSQPTVSGSPYRGNDGIPDIPECWDVMEFISHDRIKGIRQSADIIHRTETVFTIGGCVDPVTAAMQMIGAESFLMGIIMDPDQCEKWTCALTTLFTKEIDYLSDCSDCVQIVAISDTDVLPPGDFDRFVGVPVSKMIGASHSYTTVHSCGNTRPVLDKLVSLGEDGLCVETAADPTGIYRTCSSKVKLIGGISPIDCLMMGDEKDVRDSAEKYADIGYPIIAPECGVPPRTSNGNLQALSEYRVC